METNNSEALKLARDYSRKVREGIVKFNKRRAVRELAAFGLFSPYEIARVLDVSAEFVRNNAHEPFPPARPPFRSWDERDLDALHKLSESRGLAVHRLVKSLVGLRRTSVRAIVELCGWTRSEVMEALQYDPETNPLL